MKPCKYKKFTFIGEAQTTSFQSEHFSLSLWAVSKDTWLETEVGPYTYFCGSNKQFLSGANLSSLLPPCWDWRHAGSLSRFLFHRSLGQNSTSAPIGTFTVFLFERNKRIGRSSMSFDRESKLDIEYKIEMPLDFWRLICFSRMKHQASDWNSWQSL